MTVWKKARIDSGYFSKLHSGEEIPKSAAVTKLAKAFPEASRDLLEAWAADCQGELRSEIEGVYKEIGVELPRPSSAPSPSRFPIAQIEKALEKDEDSRSMEAFVGGLARLADVVARDPNRAEFLESLYDAISGRRARVMSPAKPVATPNPGEVA